MKKWSAMNTKNIHDFHTFEAKTFDDARDWVMANLDYSSVWIIDEIVEKKEDTNTYIEDDKVINVWKGYDEEGEIYTIEVTPDWYEENGTPVDMCGRDMKYSHTYIKE